MAIKRLFGRGIGFNDGQIGWVVTRGFGALTDLGAGSLGRYAVFGLRTRRPGAFWLKK